MPSSFQNTKDLQFVITLANGKVFQNGQNTVTLQGLRASVYIENAGGAMLGTMKAQIFGVSESDMNTLTSLIWDNLIVTPSGSTFAFNSIQVFALDGTQTTLVYQGDILNCWGVFMSMPEVYLYIEAQIGYLALVQPVPPLSISADTAISTVMGQLAQQMGYQFENNNVQGTVKKGTYLGSTLMEQARTLMQSFRFWMYLDGTNTLAIAPYGQARSTIAPLISPQTGLIEYPAFNSTGVNFATLYNRDLLLGGPVEIQSSIPKARGTWIVTSMSHQLTSQMPGGPW
ncbi:MAG: baseplate hub protein, partial [Terracidiphilus sp.]